MKIAHISDLHLLALDGVGAWRFLNKRLTGYMNLRFRRRSVHKAFAVHAAAKAIRALGVDHVVVTGDLSNLALEGEFELARRVFEDELGLPASEISVVPGNHDAYTSGAHRSARFARTFARFLSSDLPGLGGDAPFPFVRLRGPAAIIGLSTAVPRPPFVASGTLGKPQLEVLARVLEHPEVKRRTPVILQHHPIHQPDGRLHAALEGLLDVDHEVRLLAGLTRGLVLHGHLHRRVHRRLATDRGQLDVVGATSASLLDAREARMGGFNLYEITDDGALASISSHRMSPDHATFLDTALPAA